MSNPDFQTLNRAGLLEEMAKLGRPMEDGEIDALADTGALPVRAIDSTGYPLFALVQLLDGVAIRELSDVETLRARGRLFASAFSLDPDAIRAAREALEAILEERAVLGELRRFLPVIEWAALDTLRGDARVEWRIWAAVEELKEIAAAVSRATSVSHIPELTGSDSAPTAAPEPSRPRPISMLSAVASASEPHRAPSASPSASSPSIALPKAAKPIAVAGPYALGPEDFHPPGYHPEGTARVPVLRDQRESLNTGVQSPGRRTDTYAASSEVAAAQPARVEMSESAQQLAMGLATADAHRREGHHTDEEQVLEELLETLSSGPRRRSVVRRLAAVYVARNGGADSAIALYRDAVERGDFDEKIVHALTSLLRAAGESTEVVRMQRTAASRSGEDERLRYLRQAAKAARELVRDEEVALELLEEIAEDSDDGEVMLELATKLRELGHEPAELAVLTRARERLPIATFPELHYRVAELEFGQPRGAQISSEILGELVEQPGLPSPLVAEAVKFAQRVATRSGDLTLADRWKARAGAHHDAV